MQVESSPYGELFYVAVFVLRGYIAGFIVLVIQEMHALQAG